MGKILDRVARAFGYGPVRSQASFGGASQSRLTADWAFSILDANKELNAGELTILRGRSRRLVNSNDYAAGFIGLLERNVIGSNGIALQAVLKGNGDELDDAANQELERAWGKWGELGNPTTCGRMSWIDVQKLAVRTLATDGEVFLRKVRGFAHNRFGFALQFIDADEVDANLNRERRGSGDQTQNAIVMGIELDEYRRPVNYYIKQGGAGLGMRHAVIPAADMLHWFLFRRGAQTRGVPFMHTAMYTMHMLGGYTEAELVAARLAACKMGAIVSQDGDEYDTRTEDEKKKNPTGQVEMEAQPGSFWNLPLGKKLETWDPQHPNAAFSEFVKAMLRGMAVGCGSSYASFAGDLREVNFSSIRQGVLEEREAYRLLQTSARDHLCAPVFAPWLGMAMLKGRAVLMLPPAPIDRPDYYLDGVTWQPRGWQWVDPKSDVDSNIAGMRAGFTTLADVAASQGRDWREVLKQRAAEVAYAKKLDLELDLSTSGALQQQQNNSADPSQPPQRTAALSTIRLEGEA